MTAGSPLVMIVEDEPQMRRFLRVSLESHGYRLLEVGTIAEALRLSVDHNPDLVLLDLGLPDGDGIDLVKRMREWTPVPIIVISARGREHDKVLALDAGADDYLTKPFGVNELFARMRVAERHARRAVGTSDRSSIDAGPLHLDLARREVQVAGRPVHLTPIEYKLLVLLASNAGKVLTHSQILREVWGPSRANQNHYVRVHMAELRKKIEADVGRPRLIVTEPGVGYRFDDRALGGALPDEA